MKMLAKAIKGKEFCYDRWSAHKVSTAGAEKICTALNKIRYQLKSGEVWHVYDCDGYSLEYTGAGYQSFTMRKGSIYDKRA